MNEKTDITEEQAIENMKEMLEMKNTKDRPEGMLFLAVKWTKGKDEMNIQILQGNLGDELYQREAFSSRSDAINKSIMHWVRMGVRAMKDSQDNLPKEILSMRVRAMKDSQDNLPKEILSMIDILEKEGKK